MNERTSRRSWVERVVATVLLVGGAIVLLYPVVGYYWNNHQQYEFAQKYGNDVQKADPKVLENGLAKARAYNAALRPSVLTDPWTGPPMVTETRAYKDYEKVLNDFSSMSRVRVPTRGIDLPIFHGTTEDVLSQGAGHIYGTSLPVGGPSTHTAISAHSAMPSAVLFDHVEDMRVGELFYLDTYGVTMAYKVSRIDTVLPTDLSLLRVTPGKDLATLITCTPHGINSHRLLVTGERVPLDTGLLDRNSKGFDWSIQSWMWLRIVPAVIALALWTWALTDWVRRSRTPDNPAAPQEETDR